MLTVSLTKTTTDEQQEGLVLEILTKCQNHALKLVRW